MNAHHNDKARLYQSPFVPHDLAAPIAGNPSGPLAGLTVAIKDMYDIAGTSIGGGNPDWLAAQKPASTHAAAVARLLDAGATLIGKAICDEFFFSLAGVNAHYGTPPNPRAPGRIPGGSSSGSASAVAVSACDFALGSDTGGSVRVPAALCGLYGIRTTLGRVDLRGAMEMSPSFDTAGWLASGPGVFRTIGAALLEGERVASTITRMVVLDDGFENAEPRVVRVLRDFLDQAEADLPQRSHQRIAPEGLDVWREAFRVVQGREIWKTYGDFVTRASPRLGPGIKERFAFAASITEDDERSARLMHARVRAHLREIVAPGAILVLPTAPSIAPLIETTADDLESIRVRTLRLTCIAGLGGLPQVSIPVGTVENCPVGLSLIGWAGGDEALLDLAFRVSRHCGLAG